MTADTPYTRLDTRYSQFRLPRGGVVECRYREASRALRITNVPSFPLLFTTQLPTESLFVGVLLEALLLC